MIGRVTAEVAIVDGGEQEAGLAGPGGPADCAKWSPSWQGRCACQSGGPPYPV